MAKPEFPQNGVRFDLGAVEQDLRNEIGGERAGHTVRTLVHTPDLRVLLVVIKNGGHLSEHHANATVSVHTVSGHVRLQLPDRSVDVRAGELLVLERGLKHDVEAVADSAFLLTLGWHGTP